MAVELWNARSQQIEFVEWQNEGTDHVAVFADGHAVKFPACETTEELRAMIDQHNHANGPVVLASDVALAREQMDAITSGL